MVPTLSPAGAKYLITKENKIKFFAVVCIDTLKLSTSMAALTQLEIKPPIHKSILK
jgi:hypothetical protein